MKLSLDTSQVNFEKVTGEYSIRKDRIPNNGNGMAKNKLSYLNAVKDNFPVEYIFFEGLSDQLKSSFFDTQTMMYVTIPCVGFGNQETNNIKQTINFLRQDSLYKTGSVKVVVFVNRPEGKKCDETTEELKSIFSDDPNIGVIDGDIKSYFGRTDGPFSEDMAVSENQVPIGFIRDALVYSVLLGRKKYNLNSDPLLLQMDGDFYGFKKGSLDSISDNFKNSSISFLQAGSDREGTIQTASIPGLKFGSDLMHSLPLGLKLAYNSSNEKEVKNEILFCDGIQRGIQVPQAQRLSNFLKTAGYGLTRMAHDELDWNLRASSLVDDGNISFCIDEAIFQRDNRRAVASYLKYGNPPISQRNNTGFDADDEVRYGAGKTKAESILTKDELLRVLNINLKRYAVPTTEAASNILDVLKNLGMAQDSQFEKYILTGVGEGYQCTSLGSQDFAFLQKKYER